jgi:hypothetical protein
MRNFMLLTLIFSLGACSFVKLTPQGENVAVLQASQVTNCERQGNITVNVTSKVVVNRQPTKVAQELRTVARNRAADRGDTLVATTEPRNGEQTFDIYRCRR